MSYYCNGRNIFFGGGALYRYSEPVLRTYVKSNDAPGVSSKRGAPKAVESMDPKDWGKYFIRLGAIFGYTIACFRR